MPEFEETSTETNPSHTYAPSTDAKPRTRRRSGGFKKEYSSAPKGNMGEIDPTEALKTEKLSGGAKSAEDVKTEAPKRERSERPAREPREPKAERPQKQERAEKAPENTATPEPSEETLAAIKRVEEGIAKRKAERDAKHAERKKAQAAKREAKPEGKKPAPKAKSSNKQAPAKKGLLASILSIFGLGPKEPVKKSSGKGGNRQGGQNRKGGRPQGKGGNRGGQNRQGGQNRGRGGKGRGGQNRRRGGGGQRRQPAHSE